MRAFCLVLCLFSAPLYAQAPSPCEKLAGEEQRRCLRQQEQLERERLGREEGREGEKPRKCDALFGPEKELCLKRGGTVRAKAPGSRHGE